MRTVLPALAATFLLTQAAAAQTTAWADKLFGGTTAHDFGVVAHGAQLKHAFKVTNIYKEPLEITGVRVSCTCVSAAAAAKVLQPNESTTLNVTMDGSRFSGPKSVRIYVTVGPKYVSTATLQVSANARSDVVFTPQQLDFGPVARGQTPTKQIDVEHVGGADWQVLEIVKSSTSPFELKAENLPQQVGAGFGRKGYRIFATLRADAPAGAFRQEVVLKTNDPSAPVLTFNVLGTVQAALSVSPAALSAVGLKVGEAQSKKVIVRGQRAFRIKSIEGLGEGVTADIPDRQDTTMIVTVTLQPTRPGELRRQLKILTDQDGESATITIDGDVAP